jgi:hypothetical protein
VLIRPQKWPLSKQSSNAPTGFEPAALYYGSTIDMGFIDMGFDHHARADHHRHGGAKGPFTSRSSERNVARPQ